MGIARLMLIGLAILLLLTVVVAGGRALLASLGAPESSSAASSSSTSAGTSTGTSVSASPSARVPTVRIVCVADRCPVFVRVPGANVLIDRDMNKGEEAAYFEPELDVVLSEPETVQVVENGKPGSPGKPGERQSFTVKRAPGP